MGASSTRRPTWLTRWSQNQPVVLRRAHCQMQTGTVGRVRMFENKWQISQAFNPANLHFSAWFLLFLCLLLHLCQVFAKSPCPIFNCDRAKYWNNKSKVTPVRLVGRVWSTVPVQLSTRSSRQAGSSVSSGENFSRSRSWQWHCHWKLLRCDPERLANICCDPDGLYEGYTLQVRACQSAASYQSSLLCMLSSFSLSSFPSLSSFHSPGEPLLELPIFFC